MGFAGGENGFLKRPGMVDEYDQQVSTHMDGKLYRPCTSLLYNVNAPCNSNASQCTPTTIMFAYSHDLKLDNVWQKLRV